MDNSAPSSSSMYTIYIIFSYVLYLIADEKNDGFLNSNEWLIMNFQYKYPGKYPR